MFNDKKITWNDIVSSYSNNPRDVKTVPLRGAGRWFYVYAENNNVYAENARNHSVSSKIKGRRVLEKNKVDDVLAIYDRRKRGESVSKIAVDTTVNQVYWYGIFADMGI